MSKKLISLAVLEPGFSLSLIISYASSYGSSKSLSIRLLGVLARYLGLEALVTYHSSSDLV